MPLALQRPYSTARRTRVLTSPLRSDLRAWYDASDTSTITDAGAGAVSAWADKSGNAHNVAQGTGAARPTTGTVTIGGRNAVSFDGGDLLTNTSPFIDALTNHTIFLACTLTTALGTGVVLMSEGASGSANPLWAIDFESTGSNSLNEIRRGDAGGTPSPNNYDSGKVMPRDGTAHLLRFIANEGVTSIPALDGNAGTAAAGYGTGTATLNQFAIGALFRNTTSGHMTGRIGEILVYSGMMSADDIVLTEAYLQAKWSLP